MNITVSTEEYRRSHGKAPRGRGLWLFVLGDNGRWLAEPCGYNGTYGEARANAIQQARTLGLSDVVVQP